MAGHKTTFLGETIEGEKLIIRDGFDEFINTNIETLVESWQGALDMTGGVV